MKRLIERLEEARSANVDTFLTILMGHLTQYDQKQKARGKYWNPYAIGHYIGALQRLRKAVKKYHNRDDAEAMDALKEAIGRHFELPFTPANAVIRKIDAWLEKGRTPKYPMSKTRK